MKPVWTIFFGSPKIGQFDLIFLKFLKKMKPEKSSDKPKKPIGLSFSFKFLILNKKSVDKPENLMINQKYCSVFGFFFKFQKLNFKLKID
jgi:hypothetical protein